MPRAKSALFAAPYLNGLIIKDMPHNDMVCCRRRTEDYRQQQT
ncbi:hypothetical protein NEISUBOT_05034 [Neisseria subflava NJ9703]|uniref:Uncharacterized protein n=1 Tax=Neisseria subflava NJ9703 TaxID=546268 RepID=A0A9W5IPW7_NEISU|nr:hypothetical protein NEISUBOT_05034 [Neisseria subflava NJ9703]